MAQYIDKSDLVAKLKEIEHETNYVPFTDEVLGKRMVCKSLLSFIDNLEVKELEENVDFDSAVERYIVQHKGELRGYFDIRRIARYFHELGRLAGYVSINKKKKEDK